VHYSVGKASQGPPGNLSVTMRTTRTVSQSSQGPMLEPMNSSRM
jgi:hypothetical protein